VETVSCSDFEGTGNIFNPNRDRQGDVFLHRHRIPVDCDATGEEACIAG
jgi:hypothetical protein